MDKFEYNNKIEEASKLLYLGIKGDITKKDNLTFKTLYKKFRSDSELRTIFEIIVEGMRLEILDVDDTGVYLHPKSDSIFCIRKEDVKSISDSEIAPYTTLVFIALASFLFPQAQSFEKDPYEGFRFTDQELVDHIEEHCNLIMESSKVEDPEIDKEEFLLLAQAFLNLKNESSPDSKERNTKQYFVKRALRFLLDQNFLKKSGNIYLTQIRLRLEIENLAKDTYIKDLIDKFRSDDNSNNQ